MDLKSKYLALDKILSLEKWQALQDSLAEVTRLAIITINNKGEPITAHSDIRSFCKMARACAKTRELCQTCDARAGFESVRTNKPYIYLCHSKIVDIAIPIAVNGTYIGAVMAGQARLKDDDHTLEQLLEVGFSREALEPKMKQAYDELPILSYAEIKQVADMLFDLSNYLVEEAIHKNVLLNTYERIADGESDFTLKEELGEAVVNAFTKEDEAENYVASQKTLQPAFDYIFANKGATINQKDLAELCHLSVGHFSRLFKLETNQTFTFFINDKKVSWAKQLLEKTELSINDISEQLGFSDSGYFIKIFKQHEKSTPGDYRRRALK